MNIKQIVEKYLRDNGYDGLCNADISCGCGLKEGLFPCEGDYSVLDCVAAVSKIATKDDIDDWGDFEVGDEIFIPAKEKEA